MFSSWSGSCWKIEEMILIVWEPQIQIFSETIDFPSFSFKTRLIPKPFFPNIFLYPQYEFFSNSTSDKYLIPECYINNSATFQLVLKHPKPDLKGRIPEKYLDKVDGSGVCSVFARNIYQCYRIRKNTDIMEQWSNKWVNTDSFSLYCCWLFLEYSAELNTGQNMKPNLTQ